MPARAAWREIWPGPGDKPRKALGRVKQNLRSGEGQVGSQIIRHQTIALTVGVAEQGAGGK